MRDWPRRLPLIGLGALGALIALILAGNYVYQTNGSLFGESPAASVSLKGSDLPPGMTRCNVSGRPHGGYTPPYGATDVWTVVYADSCNLPPARRYAFSWVLQFESERAAVAAYKAFVGSQVCTIAHGCVGGLGRTPPSLAGPPKAPVNLALVGVLGHGRGTPSCSRSKASWAVTKGRKQFLAWTPGLNRFQRLVVTSQSPPSHITPTFCLAIHSGGVQGSVPVTAEAGGSSPPRPTTENALTQTARSRPDRTPDSERHIVEPVPKSVDRRGCPSIRASLILDAWN